MTDTRPPWRFLPAVALGLAIALAGVTLACAALGGSAPGPLLLLEVGLAVAVVAAVGLCAAVGERPGTGAALRASEAQFRQLAESLPQLVWTCLPDGPCDYLSPQWVAYTGRPEAEQLGSGWLAQIHPDDRGPTFAAWGAAVAHDGPLDVEFRIRRADGAYRWFKTRATALRDEAGRTAKWYGTNTDIHDQKCAEEEVRRLNAELAAQVAERTAVAEARAAALRESEKRFRAVFDQSFQFIGLLSADGTLMEGNRTAFAAAGVAEADVLGKPFWETPWWTHDPAQQARLRAAVGRAAAGETVRFEATHLAPDGRVIWVDFSLKPFHDAAGSVSLLIPEGRDITDMKRAAEALAAAETLLRQFIKYAPAAIAMLDADMRYVQASDRWLTDYHLAGQEIIGRSHYEVFPDIPDRWKEIHARVLGGAVEACSEDPFPRAGGGTEWLQWEARPWRTAGGGIGGLVFFTQVITDRIRAAEALRESEERLRSAFDYAAIGMAVVAPDGRWRKVNRALCELLGYAPAELLATDFQTITHPADLGTDLALVGKVLSGELATYQMEKRYVHKAGHLIHVLLSVSLVRDARGAPLDFISQIQDITERKRAEERLLASVREKEVMLKEIHHRVKNNLQIISSLLDLQADAVADPAALAAFRESRGRVRSMALIHERLYRSENLASVEFGTYARHLAEDLFRAYRADDEVRLEVGVSAPPVSLDLAIPCGLLVNELISNCLKYAFAGRDGGTIRVSLEPAGAGAYELAVADDGVGLPPGFDFRQPASFGLQLANTLAEQLGGELELDPAAGTRFAVRFPSREQREELAR